MGIDLDVYICTLPVGADLALATGAVAVSKPSRLRNERGVRAEHFVSPPAAHRLEVTEVTDIHFIYITTDEKIL